LPPDDRAHNLSKATLKNTLPDTLLHSNSVLIFLVSKAQNPSVSQKEKKQYITARQSAALLQSLAGNEISVEQHLYDTLSNES
jgi:hypothetical protein